MKEIIYTSYSQLGSPRKFLRELKEDLQATKELGRRMFITNLRSQYRQSWLTYVWLIIPPIITMLIWFFLSRANVLNANVADNIYPLYVLTGVFIWQTFVESLLCPLQKLQTSRWILAKVKVPHEAFILAGLAEILFNLVIRTLILLIMFVWFGITLKLTILLAPFGIISVIILGFALGWLVAPLGMLYNDVFNGLNISTSIWFFLTPIIYAMPDDTSSWVFVKYNPVTPLLVTTRNWILYGHHPAKGFLLVLAFSLSLLIISWLFYRLAKPHLVARFSN